MSAMSTAAVSSFDSLDPATDEPLGTYPIHDADHVGATVEAARTAAGWWSELGFAERKERLLRWGSEITRRAPELADLVHRETGKPHFDAMLEIVLAIDHLSWAAKHARKVLGRQRKTPGLLMINQAASVEYQPLGVIGVIGPWNYPAFVPRGLAERATRVLGTAVCGAFGTTETCLGALSAPTDEPVKVWGTDGRALEGITLRITDDHGGELAPGIEGNFEIYSPTCFEGYLDRPDLTAAAFTDDGWYKTGDLGIIDESGFIRVTGRVKDVINRGGEKVPVAEIEELIYNHPAVDDVAVVAMPDERLGERACAYVALRDGEQLDFDQLVSYLDEHQVAKYYWPERLEHVDKLPRNAAGKIQKFLLREWATRLRPEREDRQQTEQESA